MTDVQDSSPFTPTGLALEPDMPVCQTDLPLDWYQDEFKPYAEEYMALPDRKPATIFGWLDQYVLPAQDHFGDSLMLLAHYYMGGEIVKVVERYGGGVADSYKLALIARDNPEKKVLVESAVHFMAESIALLSNPDQEVWITNPKAGCTMELLAKDWQVLPFADQMFERYGADWTTISYMNTSGRIKALAGRTGGAVCTSSNAHLVMEDALANNKRVLFVPDQHLGRNTAFKLGLKESDLVVLPDPRLGALQLDDKLAEGGLERIDRAKVILWGSACGVHTIFTPEMVAAQKRDGFRVLIHPESPHEAVKDADGVGSTAFLWGAVADAKAGDKLAIGTEGHFVRNAIDYGRQRGVDVRHLADVPGFAQAGCGCATMSRNDPPHLAGMLDLLRRGEAPGINRVLAGDMIDEITMRRDRMDGTERAELIKYARASMESMIASVEKRR